MPCDSKMAVRLRSCPPQLCRSPADLNSFAVIDTGSRSGKPSNVFMKDLFRAMSNHGMKGLPEVNDADEALNDVTVSAAGGSPEHARFRQTPVSGTWLSFCFLIHRSAL